jgi:hypothetical protein
MKPRFALRDLWSVLHFSAWLALVIFWAASAAGAIFVIAGLVWIVVYSVLFQG